MFQHRVRNRFTTQPCHVYSFISEFYSLEFSGIILDGNVADSECQYADQTHVYKDRKLNYSVTLTKVDLKNRRNSFYEIHLLESDDDDKKKYWIFRKWGRIGNTIGDSKTDPCNDVDDAISTFCAEFNDKTGNNFGEKLENLDVKFEKRPGKYNLVDIDCSENAKLAENFVSSTLSLPESVRNLMRLLFGKYAMSHMIFEFELDMAIMPLGKLSLGQLKKAMEVLKRISQEIGNEYPKDRLLYEASSEFYALVPHAVGLDNLPIISSKEMLEKKNGDDRKHEKH